MSDQMPTGWMSADEARKWTRRGMWCCRDSRETFPVLVDSSDECKQLIDDGESWRWVGPHPDDEPAAGAVEIEAWVVVIEDGHSYATRTRDAADSLAAGFIQATKVVRLTGYTTPPTLEAVETVRGVSRE